MIWLRRDTPPQVSLLNSVLYEVIYSEMIFSENLFNEKRTIECKLYGVHGDCASFHFFTELSLLITEVVSDEQNHLQIITHEQKSRSTSVESRTSA
jgi:hypothetical protein